MPDVTNMDYLHKTPWYGWLFVVLVSVIELAPVVMGLGQ